LTVNPSYQTLLTPHLKPHHFRPNTPIAATNVAINTFNLASGTGKHYNANSSSLAIVKGLDFYLAPQETFKFDFNDLTTLGAESTSSRETAFAQSKTCIVICATDGHGTQTPIDRLLISSSRTTNNPTHSLTHSPATDQDIGALS